MADEDSIWSTPVHTNLPHASHIQTIWTLCYVSRFRALLCLDSTKVSIDTPTPQCYSLAGEGDLEKAFAYAQRVGGLHV